MFNFSIDEILDLSVSAEEKLLPNEDVEMLYLRTGSGNRWGSSNPDRISTMIVDFYDENERESGKDGYTILEDLRESSTDTSGFLVQIEAEKAGPPIGRSVDIDILGDDPIALARATKLIRNYVENEVTGLVDVEDTLQKRGVEWEMEIDKTRAAQFGASINDVGAAVQMITNGIKVG